MRYVIKEVAEGQGFSIRSLAKKAGLSYETVHLLWNNKQESATMKTLQRLAKALGVGVKDLIEDEPEESG
jgi:DNA-binding Xre family transcriptional regulator